MAAKHVDSRRQKLGTLRERGMDPYGRRLDGVQPTREVVAAYAEGQDQRARVAGRMMTLRNFGNYKGDCGICEYVRWCGGCRARAYAVTGDYLEQEPYCAYVPKAHRRT